MPHSGFQMANDSSFPRRSRITASGSTFRIFREPRLEQFRLRAYSNPISRFLLMKSRWLESARIGSDTYTRSMEAIHASSPDSKRVTGQLLGIRIIVHCSSTTTGSFLLRFFGSTQPPARNQPGSNSCHPIPPASTTSLRSSCPATRRATSTATVESSPIFISSQVWSRAGPVAARLVNEFSRAALHDEPEFKRLLELPKSKISKLIFDEAFDP